ncbi:hypothetical protein F4818DRAFT_455825 [Hypoxylon cercidicola]|nr:hypothetical protein F4818DRAFT_455825 [Hypoxylon cercidicola]
MDESNGLTLLNIKDGAKPTEKFRSIVVLQKNQNLYLYKNLPEVTQETKIKPSGEKDESNCQTDTSAQNGVGFRVNLSPQRQLEAFDFLEIASSIPVIQPKAATLKYVRRRWVDFIRALHAIALFRVRRPYEPFLNPWTASILQTGEAQEILSRFDEKQNILRRLSGKWENVLSMLEGE